MGLLQNLGRAISHGAEDVGKGFKSVAGVPTEAIKRNRGVIGTVIQDAAPLAALIPGVGIPLAAAIGAGGAAIGKGIQPGSNFGSIARAGALGGVEAGGGAALKGLTAGGQAAGQGADLSGGINGATQDAGADIASLGGPGVTSTAVGDALPGASLTPASSGFSALGAPSIASGPLTSSSDLAALTSNPSTGGLLSKSLGLVEKYPNAVGMGLQGVGNIANLGNEQRLTNAQINALQTNTGLTADQLARRQATNSALAPYWASVASSGGKRPGIAPNPYLPQPAGG